MYRYKQIGDTIHTLESTINGQINLLLEKFCNKNLNGITVESLEFVAAQFSCSWVALANKFTSSTKNI